MGGSVTMNMMMLRCLCILSCLVMMIQGRSLIDEQFHDGQSNGAEKVKLYLYYESLCPYSARFIVNGLAPIFNNGLIDIVDLQLFPWGNAKLKSDKSFVCQHGVDECLLNTVEACAIDAWPKLDEHFPYINCVESLAINGKYREWEICFGKYSKTVKECSSSEKGKQLELKYAAETNALKPRHEYVPWVVLNGQPLYEEYDNFTKYVCKAYKGTPPSACSGVPSGRSQTEDTFRSHSVSYADKASMMALSEKVADTVAAM